MKGTLYLIPAPLGEGPLETAIPSQNIEIISRLKWFIVEEIRTARRFIKKTNPQIVPDELHFLVFNEHTPKEDLTAFLEPLLAGNDVGLLSEAGLPCIADPGSLVTDAAHQKGIIIKPLTGPSSLMLALMASGMNGQNFTFHGYLPVDKAQRSRKIKEIEQVILSTGQTQIFIEAPYRNLQLLESLIQHGARHLKLCIAADLTTPSEWIGVKTLEQWKKNLPDIHKKPAVFVLNR